MALGAAAWCSQVLSCLVLPLCRVQSNDVLPLCAVRSNFVQLGNAARCSAVAWHFVLPLGRIERSLMLPLCTVESGPVLSDRFIEWNVVTFRRPVESRKVVQCRSVLLSRILYCGAVVQRFAW